MAYILRQNENELSDILIQDYKIHSTYQEPVNDTLLIVNMRMTPEDLEWFWPIYDSKLYHIQILSEDKLQYYYNSPLWSDYYEIVITPKFNDDNQFYYDVVLKARPRPEEETIYVESDVE